MVRSKKTLNPFAKTSALLTAIMVLLFSFFSIPDWSAVGVAIDSPSAARFIYPFFHASPLHAALNAWCLLSIVFIYDLSIWRLLSAYVVAVAVPAPILSQVPTVGLSSVCFFLLGSILPVVARRLWFLACSAIFLLLGFLFPSLNPLIHLYGYLAGLVVGLFNIPLSWLSPKK